jgi:hypothetical protein
MDCWVHQQESHRLPDVHNQLEFVGLDVFQLGGYNLHTPDNRRYKLASERGCGELLRLTIRVPVHLQDRLLHVLIHETYLRDWVTVYVLRVPAANDSSGFVPDQVYGLHYSS